MGTGALYCFEDFFIPIRDYGPCIIYVPVGTYLNCPARLYVRGNYYGVEIDMAAGPQTLAVTGAGTWAEQFSRQWVLVLCEDLSLDLYQVEGSKITSVPWDVAPPVLDASAQHVGLAFDQSSRPVITWQETDGIHVRQYDEINGVYAYSGPYAGTDPALLNDADVMYDVSISDAILFYLSTDRLNLNYRIQSENFATEHNLFAFAQPVLVDTVDALFYRYQVRYALASGDPEQVATVDQSLRSLLYPYAANDPFHAAVNPLRDGLYKLVVSSYSPPVETSSGIVGALLDGEYAMPVLVEAESDVSSAAVGVLVDGAYIVVIFEESLAEAAAASVGPVADGAYTRTIFSESLSETASGSIGSLGDGSYT